jgi:hypothetical protein
VPFGRSSDEARTGYRADVIRALPLVLFVVLALAIGLHGDAHIHRLSTERGMPIFDAGRTGYPPRMRRRPGPET